jgi:hypothetical protein
VNSLYAQWLELKRREDEAKALRNALEVEMSQGIPDDWEGSKTWEDGPYKIKASRKLNRKVDGNRVRDISAQFGLEEYTNTLFRWKPEIDAKAWKAADETVTKLFSDAITTTPGKVGFVVEEILDEEKKGVA